MNQRKDQICEEKKEKQSKLGIWV